MDIFSKLGAFRSDEKAVNMVVETPRGSRAKYKFDANSGVFELHKALALGYAFPFPFGFIPGTRGDDGDPLDLLLVTTLQPPMGAVVPTRLIGVIKVEQTDKGKEEQRNDRLIGVPDVGHEDRSISELDELSGEQIKDIENFFIESGARDGKKLRIIGRKGPDSALKLVRNQLTT